MRTVSWDPMHGSSGTFHVTPRVRLSDDSLTAATHSCGFGTLWRFTVLLHHYSEREVRLLQPVIACLITEGCHVLDDLLTPSHLIFILILALLIFGPRRLPEIGSALGKGIREFRQAMTQLGQAPENKETALSGPSVQGSPESPKAP